MAGCVAIDLTVSSVDLTVSSGGGAEGARAARRKRLRPEAGDTIDLTREGHGEGGGGSGDKPRARGGARRETERDCERERDEAIRCARTRAMRLARSAWTACRLAAECCSVGAHTRCAAAA